MIETQLIKAATDTLTRRGAWWTEPSTGTPTIVGAYRGRPLALHIRPPGSQQTRIEAKRLAHAAKAGAIAAVITTPSQLAQLLDRIDAKTDTQQAA